MRSGEPIKSLDLADTAVQRYTMQLGFLHSEPHKMVLSHIPSNEQTTAGSHCKYFASDCLAILHMSSDTVIERS
jgi:hypothetical protein